MLENIGLADAIDSCLDVLLPKGCTLSEDGRLLFPRSLIEDTLAIAARNFTLHAQDPQFEMCIRDRCCTWVRCRPRARWSRR